MNMSELDKVVAALVATEVTKQLGERNSLPYVKRAAVTAAQWRELVTLEAWAIATDIDSAEWYIDADGVKWYSIIDDSVIWGSTLSARCVGDAVHNLNAPVRFRNSGIDLDANVLFVAKGNCYRLATLND